VPPTATPTLASCDASTTGVGLATTGVGGWWCSLGVGGTAVGVWVGAGVRGHGVLLAGHSSRQCASMNTAGGGGFGRDDFGMHTQGHVPLDRLIWRPKPLLDSAHGAVTAAAPASRRRRRSTWPAAGATVVSQPPAAAAMHQVQ
jgi:hypothetical protein